jgi:hypothetical protein
LALLVIAGACADSSSTTATSSTATSSTATTAPADTAPDNTGTSTTPATTTPTSGPPPVEIVQAELREIALETPPLELLIAIPHLEGVPGDTGDAVNQYLLDITTRSEQAFVRDVTLYLDEVGPQEGPLSFLELFYEVGVLKPELLSMRFDETTYFQGAANPSRGVYTITVDLDNGEVIVMEDLFTGTEWAFALDFLVRQAVADTYYQGDPTELDAWVDPDDLLVPTEFLLRPVAFEFSFQELAVGPAVLGAPSVRLPYSEIGVYIDPNGPVGRLAEEAEVGCATIDAFGTALDGVFTAGAGSAEQAASLEELRDRADDMRGARPDLTSSVDVLAEWAAAFVDNPSADLTATERDAIEAANDTLRAELELCA